VTFEHIKQLTNWVYFKIEVNRVEMLTENGMGEYWV